MATQLQDVAQARHSNHGHAIAGYIALPIATYIIVVIMMNNDIYNYCDYYDTIIVLPMNCDIIMLNEA